MRKGHRASMPFLRAPLSQISTYSPTQKLHPYSLWCFPNLVFISEMSFPLFLIFSGSISPSPIFSNSKLSFFYIFSCFLNFPSLFEILRYTFHLFCEHTFVSGFNLEMKILPWRPASVTFILTPFYTSPPTTLLRNWFSASHPSLFLQDRSSCPLSSPNARVQ